VFAVRPSQSIGCLIDRLDKVVQLGVFGRAVPGARELAHIALPHQSIFSSSAIPASVQSPMHPMAPWISLYALSSNSVYSVPSAGGDFEASTNVVLASAWSTISGRVIER